MLLFVFGDCGPTVEPVSDQEEHNRQIEAPVTATNEAPRRIIASGRGWRADRCDIEGTVNGVAVTVTFMIETGAPSYVEFPISYVGKLGLAPGEYKELWPGTRYGKVAYAKVRQIRVGDVAWNNAEARIYENWGFSFGNEQHPLFGLRALKAAGLNVEWASGTCRLTVTQ